MNNNIKYLEKIFRSYFSSITINFNFNNAKLFTLLGNPSFFLFDVNFVNNINLKSCIVFRVFKHFLYIFKYEIFFLYNKIILTFLIHNFLTLN